MAWIGLVLVKATFTLFVEPEDKLEDKSLLGRLPVPNFAVRSVLNIVVGVCELDGRRDVFLISLFGSLRFRCRFGLCRRCGGGLPGGAAGASSRTLLGG